MPLFQKCYFYLTYLLNQFLFIVKYDIILLIKRESDKMRLKRIMAFFLCIALVMPNTVFASNNRYITLNLRYDYQDHYYNAEEVFVAIDGKKLTDLPMPPIILNGYSLVPAREVFEGLGAKVVWQKEVEQVYVTYGSNKVMIPIGSVKAYVNGDAHTMQTEAKIINNKTMIPLRFVSTALGFDIDWNKDTRIANIITGKASPQTTTVATTTTTTKATTTTEATTERTTAAVTEKKTETTTQKAASNISDGPSAAVVNGNFGYDYENDRLFIKNTSGAINTSGIVHYDDYYDLNYTCEIPVNLTSLLNNETFNPQSEKISKCTVTVTPQKTTVSFDENMILAMNVTQENGYVYFTPVFPKEKYDKIIVLDAGHGGKDVGAEANGLVEKELTLKMLLSAKKKFDYDGKIKCYVTRATDVYPSFDDRTNLANEVGDAFVSIHINSARNTTATGTETYSLYPNDLGNGLTSYTLAEEMLNQLLTKLETVNRKVKSENWIVLRQSVVPATLIEIGFISNEDEAAMMNNNIDTVGQAVYDGITKLFNEYPPVR